MIVTGYVPVPLQPAFDNGTYVYTVTVPNSAQVVKVRVAPTTKWL